MDGLQQAVIEQQADLGIAFDGDGDRVLFVDAKGDIVDGDELIYIIAQHRKAENNCHGVAGTQMSNLGLELSLRDLGIPFERTKVGDRYVVEALKANGWDLGGEASGHVLCSDLNSTGDGIVAALQVILALSETDTPLHELKLGMSKFPQTMINVRLKESVDISDNQAINAAVVDAEQQLDGRGRVLLRPSGTEPLIRVMVEGEDQQLVDRLVAAIAKTVEQQIG
jgi:phosphoglucosamine mutase